MPTQVSSSAPIDVDALIVDSATDFAVDGAVYTDPALFQLEMERVFERTWVFVAHDSEVAKIGDFKTAYIGLKPVIVSRDKGNKINVLLNRCRHRAAAVCRELHGNAKNFSCKYHGWTYGLDGKLIGLTMQQGGYPAETDKSTLGLHKVSRVDSYRGFIFASMAVDGPTLKEHLAPVRDLFDYQLDHSPIGRIVAKRGTHRTRYQGNWKFQAENSTDGYHGNFVHQSFWQIMGKFGNEGGQHGNYKEVDLSKIHARREKGRTAGFKNGHGLLQYPMPEGGLAVDGDGPDAEYMRLMKQSYSQEQLEKIMPQYNLWIFPNLGILLDQIRVIRPISPGETEVTLQFYDLEGVPNEYNLARFSGYERFFGPASFGSPDDVEMFAINQTGLAAEDVKWLRLDRGLARESDGDAGCRVGHPSDEVPQRAFHRRWLELMREVG